MHVRVRSILVVVIVVVCLGAALTAFAQLRSPAVRQAWEYKDGANLQIEQINRIGEDGWELVQVVTYGRDYYYIFKRPR
jgi:hypothetical protein